MLILVPDIVKSMLLLFVNTSITMLGRILDVENLNTDCSVVFAVS